MNVTTALANANINNLSEFTGIIPNPNQPVDYMSIILNVCESMDSHVVMLCMLILSFWMCQNIIYPRIQRWIDAKIKFLDDRELTKKNKKIQKIFDHIYRFHDTLALACAVFIAVIYIKKTGWQTPYLYWMAGMITLTVVILAYDLMKKIRKKDEG